jgi:hypothetical protein
MPEEVLSEAKDEEINEAKDEEINEAKDEEAPETSRLQVSSSVPPVTNRSKFPAVPAVSPAKHRRNEVQADETVVSEAKEEETEPTVPPERPLAFYPEPPINEYNSDVQVREGEQPNNDDVRPGAVRVAGINARQMSQHSFLHSDQGETEAEVSEQEANENDAVVPSSVVAEAVDEDQLLDELLSRRQSQGMVLQVQAENVVCVDEDEAKVDRKWISFPFPKRRTIVFAIVILAVAGVVVIAVLVSRSRKHSKQQTQPPSTLAPPVPTTPSPISPPPPSVANQCNLTSPPIHFFHNSFGFGILGNVTKADCVCYCQGQVEAYFEGFCYCAIPTQAPTILNVP